jgi:hypothetical protein
MAQRVSKYPDLPAKDLRGLSERSAPGNYPPGVFDLLRGLYPARNGLLQRIPPHSLLATIGGRILQIHATGNTNSDILIQTDAGIYAYTLDELLARTVTPAIVNTALSEEETMSMAIIVQRESNALPGGSIQGWVSSGPDTTAAANTFYPRRLTNMVCNESANAVATVSSFTAASGGGGAASTGSTFTLIPGTYRIRGRFVFYANSAGVSFLCGLYNTTTSLFECHYDGASNNIPVLSNPVSVENATTGQNLIAGFDARILVSSTNKTFQISQECSGSTPGRALAACGAISGTLTTANVNSAAATLEYASVTILRTA